MARNFIGSQFPDTEFRITVVEEEPEKPDPFRAIGYARRHYHPDDTRTTDEIMAELREGEED